MLTLKADDRIIRRLLTDPDSQGLVLLTILLHLHGEEVFGSDTVEQLDPAELWADTHAKTGIWLDEEAENKVNALMVAMLGDDFYVDDITFASVANALFDGDLGDMVNGMFEAPALVEVMWAVTEVELARDEEDGPPVFGPRIRRLIDEVAAKEAMDVGLAEQEVEQEITDMFTRLKLLGVTPAELRILREEHIETMEAMEREMNDTSGIIQ